MAGKKRCELCVFASLREIPSVERSKIITELHGQPPYTAYFYKKPGTR